MLHKETVERETFELLTKLMHDPALADFNLAGGTALALYMGHRKSIDLDLFSPYPFDATELNRYLTEKYGFIGTFNRKNTLKGHIDGVLIDCITHGYPYVMPAAVSPEGVRLYSVQDIAAMKLSAIADNGSRLKDFIDIAYLSTRLSVSDMLQAYELKFPNSTGVRPLKGLTFFNDIDFDEPINMLNGTLDWKIISKRIADMIKHSNTVFLSFPVKAPRHAASIAPRKKTPKL